MKLFAMLLLTVVGFFQLIFSPFLPEKPEPTSWIEDGRYCKLYPEEKNMELLMGFAETDDIGPIAEAFSEKARRSAGDLDGSLRELTCFLRENVTSWEGCGDPYSQANNIVSRIMELRLDTPDGPYTCLIRDKYGIGRGSPELYGFQSISVFPEELHTEYAAVGYSASGAFLAYRTISSTEAAENAQAAMEKLLSLAETDDLDTFCASFCREALAAPDELREQAAALLAFLRGEVTSWETYTWRRAGQNRGEPFEYTEDAFFLLQTAAGTYRCDLRALPDGSTDVPALYSITVFPAPSPDDDSDSYEEDPVCIQKRSEPGILFVRQ